MPDQENKEKALSALVDKLLRIVKDKESKSTAEKNEWRARPLAYETLKNLVAPNLKENERLMKGDLLLAKECLGMSLPGSNHLGVLKSLMTLQSVVKLLKLSVRREFRPNDSKSDRSHVVL